MSLLETTNAGDALGRSHEAMAAGAQATYSATVRYCHDVRLRA